MIFEYKFQKKVTQIILHLKRESLNKTRTRTKKVPYFPVYTTETVKPNLFKLFRQKRARGSAKESFL